ncbi:MAG: TetR/AcrR family transcriptional regulator [Chitinophagales bacterium]|nr:TetR/AcrR family transcriptional regulator [Chitinophagales bacterium]
MSHPSKDSQSKTRERILLAAQELFYSYGIRSITMDDIARHLSISKKTIYHFFSDKHEIVQMLCRLDCDHNESRMQNIAEHAADAIDEVLQSMDFLSDMLSKMNPNLIYDLQKYHPESWKEFNAFRERHLLGTVEANLKKGIKQGLYRSDINIKIIARLRVEEVQMGLNPALFSPSKFNLHDVQLALLEHFLFGILTMQGIRLLAKYKAGKKLKKQKVVA